MATELTTEELSQIYALGREDLMAYAILTDPAYTENWHLELIAKELEEIEQSFKTVRTKQTFLIIEVPPRHGKSQLASIIFPAWFLGKNPEKHIIAASYSGDLSMDFGAKTRNMVKSPEHQGVFPNSALSPDTQAKDRWMTNEKGSYTSVGVGGTITGRGAHILLIDDPHKDRAEADSLHMRNKVFEWFRSTAYSRLEPHGVVIIIMQRWHKDDLVGRIPKLIEDIGPTAEIEVRSIKLPAIAINNEKHRMAGDALWPGRYDLTALNRIKGVQGLINWSSQYQQEPILMENQTFKQEYFRYFEEDDLLGKELIYTTTMDLAVGDKESKNGDYVAIITVGKERASNTWYMVDCCIERLDPLACCDYLFALYQKYRMVNVGIETNAYQKTFKFWLQQEMEKRRVFIPLQEIKSTVNKESRIRGLVGYYQTGQIKHRKSYMLLESQLLNFPQDQHDDGPDAVAMQLEVQLPSTAGNEAVVQAAQKHVESLQGPQRGITPVQRNQLLENYKKAIRDSGAQSF